MKVRVLLSTLLLGVGIPALAQNCNSTGSVNTLICATAQLYGPSGLLLPNKHHAAHFASASLEGIGPLGVVMGEQLSTRPLGSTGSGVSFTFDQNHVPIPTEDSLGPILTERAETIGRNRINLGVTYQHFTFGEVDGLHLDRLPVVLSHSEFQVPIGGVQVTPPFENDYITTTDRVGLALHQIVFYGSYGVTSRFDVSAEIPFEKVHLNIISNAFIVRTVACEFNATCNVGPFAGFSQCNEFHYFGDDCAGALKNTSATFTRHGDPNGIGDVVLRGKYQVIKGEKISVSGGLAVRLATGDEKNYLGSGALGLEPFGAITYRSRFSPHLRLGYQWNGDTILAGKPVVTTVNPGPQQTSFFNFSKANLPHEFLYSGGIDVKFSRRVTVAADLLGERVFNSSRFKLTTTAPDVFGNTLPNLTSYTGDYDSDAIALGAKARLKGQLVLTGNITKRINSGGLRAGVVPLIGVSYAF